jgi:phosphoheptose isomerase|tara:strand:- start:115 stop:699 length:585 start_codon:yes stop_codon:yes gene_type:complete
MLIDFEDIEQKCRNARETEEFALLSDKINKAKKIFLLGNGGLHYVASHMATDLTRLISEKTVYSFDSVGFITSNANDHGYEQLFVRWLETTAMVEDPDECLVIGMSCSGNSANVIHALHWAHEHNFNTYMISGQKSQSLHNNINEISFECEYFHTVEVLCMMIFYELIHCTGNRCPSIRGEKNRMKDSPLRNVE